MIYESTKVDPRVVSCPSCGSNKVLPTNGADVKCVCGVTLSSKGALNEHIKTENVKQLLRG